MYIYYYIFPKIDRKRALLFTKYKAQTTKISGSTFQEKIGKNNTNKYLVGQFIKGQYFSGPPNLTRETAVLRILLHTLGPVKPK